jgi:hypothetical protein
MQPLVHSSAGGRLVHSLRGDWYNKTCRIKQLTPNYIKRRDNGNNTRAQKMENIAIRHRINQELRFLYIKSLPLASAQDGHLLRIRIPEAAYM